MNSFEDFMRSIDEDEIAAEIERAVPLHIIISETDSESIETLLHSTYRKAVTDSVKVSLLYLRKYHEWLSGEFPG